MLGGDDHNYCECPVSLNSSAMMHREVHIDVNRAHCRLLLQTHRTTRPNLNFSDSDMCDTPSTAVAAAVKKNATLQSRPLNDVGLAMKSEAAQSQQQNNFVKHVSTNMFNRVNEVYIPQHDAGRSTRRNLISLTMYSLCTCYLHLSSALSFLSNYPRKQA